LTTPDLPTCVPPITLHLALSFSFLLELDFIEHRYVPFADILHIRVPRLMHWANLCRASGPLRLLVFARWGLV
jgi:hypothetical protein